MNSQLCHHLIEQVLLSVADPKLLATNALEVCKLWKQLLDGESFWKGLFERVYLFHALKTSTESWKQACLRIGHMSPEERTESLLANFDEDLSLQHQVRSVFTSIGHNYFPYFAPLHRVYPGGYALLLFKINKLDTQHTIDLKVQDIKEKMPLLEKQARLYTLGEFWVNEMQHWKGIGESDSKTEINGIEDAWTRGKAAHSHMKLWFDKIQMWIMGPATLFDATFQKQVIYNKQFMQLYFPDLGLDAWTAYWREIKLHSLTSMEDM